MRAIDVLNFRGPSALDMLAEFRKRYGGEIERTRAVGDIQPDCRAGELTIAGFPVFIDENIPLGILRFTV